ncbi:uncharacterized protein MELLADRAFT_108842 [Melampsora larici-populina 98AG31]|uniref:Uncharacterized protein n=1 Tax=Melampsora larici-populina (strain 98AG31 / pathotype 3-4-7) TaxID=747676 RepID=F4RUG1_MELLP|nr:uncharacterized protein MELLADRAFT_108842 [Melampsora larici-populina 98AG31]EGG04004.1 hypothetical protein MELLADRAFT_108842 [Melampsora larici-populina 98AG31]
MPKSKKPQKKLTFEERESMNKADINHHLEPNSKAKYESGANRFQRYCEDQDIPVCHFISIVSRELLPATVGKYLTGIAYMMRAQYPWVDQPWTRAKAVITLDKPDQEQHREVPTRGS